MATLSQCQHNHGAAQHSTAQRSTAQPGAGGSSQSTGVERGPAIACQSPTDQKTPNRAGVYRPRRIITILLGVGQKSGTGQSDDKGQALQIIGKKSADNGGLRGARLGSEAVPVGQNMLETAGAVVVAGHGRGGGGLWLALTRGTHHTRPVVRPRGAVNSSLSTKAGFLEWAHMAHRSEGSGRGGWADEMRTVVRRHGR